MQPSPTHSFSGPSKILRGKQIAVEPVPLRIVAPTQANLEPEINIIRQGEQVIGVEIHCGCGEVIRLKFESE